MQQKYVIRDRCILLFALLTFSIGTYSLFANINSDELFKVTVLQDQVKGTVTNTNGVPIPGVTVKIQGTSTGTFTNDQGVFFISASPTDILILSYIGFKTLEVPVGNSAELSLILQEEITNLDAVTVNAGYYTVKERERTGSISKVTSEEIELQPIVSPLEALQGRMAGVEIQQKSGIPGNAPVITIRGRNSLRDDGNYPMYIVDGIPINSTPINGGNNLHTRGMSPLSTLDLSSIESLEVLKDADATAIYGSRGANGVVLITTKRGRLNNKTQIETNWYTGLGTVSRKEHLLNTKEYLTLRMAALDNDARRPDENSDYDLLRWDRGRYTDWQKVLFGKTSQISKINIAVTGGSKTTSFRLGGTYYKEGVVFPGNNDYHKIAGGFNLNHNSENNKLNIHFAINYGIDQSDLPSIDNSFVSMALILPPNAPRLFNKDGTLHWDEWEYSQWNNPLASVLNRQSLDKGYNSIISLGLTYNLSKELSFKTNVGYTNLSRDYKALQSKNEFPPEIRESKSHSSRQRQTTRKSWIFEPQFTYHSKIGKGDLDGLIGMTFQKNDSENLIVTGEEFVSETLMGDLSAAERINVINNREVSYKYTALFTRLGYNWQRKYFLNLTGRRDGSSRFGPDRRFANFWAVGGAWIFTEESFTKEIIPFLSYGKLRASYGTTGSDQIGDYEYLNAYEATVGPNGLYPIGLTNPNYSWEVNKKLEAAIELAFFKRLTLGLSWHRNRSSNQLVGFPVPSTTGFNTVQANLPATIQNSGWEIEATIINVNSKHFKWQSSVNLSIPRNKLISFPNIEKTSYSSIYRVGHPLRIQLLYPYEGVDSETMLYNITDVNEDGRYDHEDRIIIKNTGKKYFGGISNNFSYKGIELSFLWEFSGQDAMKRNSNLPGTKTQQTKGFFKKWQYGANNEVQTISETLEASRAFSNAYLSDLYFTNASFLRLRTFSLSYTLPIKVMQQIGVNNCTLYIHGQNLFTLSKYKGLNIDNPGQPTIPVLRSIAFGMKIQI